MFPLYVQGLDSDNDKVFQSKQEILCVENAVKRAKDYIKMFPSDVVVIITSRSPTTTQTTYEELVCLDESGWHLDGNHFTEEEVVQKLNLLVVQPAQTTWW